MIENLDKHYTVVFLGNQNPPTEIVILIRSAERWAAGAVTGIGGKFDPNLDKDILDTAYREKSEEVPGLPEISLTEFARCVIQRTEESRGLYYFFGLLNRSLPLPPADPREGTIKWSKVNEVFDMNIIPTTRVVLEEWQKRDFRIDQPWSMRLTGTVDNEEITRNPQVLSFVEGLSSTI